MRNFQEANWKRVTIIWLKVFPSFFNSEDLRGKVSNHIIVFGDLEHAIELFETMSIFTKQYLCFVSENPPDDNWNRVVMKFPLAVYIECPSISDLKQLSKTAINFAFHVFLLAFNNEEEIILDSGALGLAEIISQHFSVPFVLFVAFLYSGK